MKIPKHITIIAILLVGAIIGLVYFYDHSDPGAAGKDTSMDTPNAHQTRGSLRKTHHDKDSKRSERLPTHTATHEVHQHRPLDNEAFSSTVNIEVRPGQTLVTGGYKRANGQYELTFLTPSTTTLGDGSEAIRLTSKIISVDPAFIQENGLASLTTKTRNTLQHAEAWNQPKLLQTFRAASQHQNTRILSSPIIQTKPAQPATLNLVREGKTRFSIESTVKKSAAGGFVVQALIERTSLPPLNKPQEPAK